MASASGDRTGDRGGVRRGVRAPIELVVLGHLPVLGGAWVTPYASQAATSLGRPVGLVRLDSGGLTIDLLGLARDALVQRADSVGEALRTASTLVGRWLIQVDELSEVTTAESPLVGAITVLSGVSQTSIVAAYRAIKSIASRARAAGAGEDGAALNIALLGATAERAAEASARVRKAAGAFLGRPIGIVVCAEKIGLTGVRSLYRGAFEGDAGRVLELIRGTQAGSVGGLGLERDAAVEGAAFKGSIAPESPARESARVDGRGSPGPGADADDVAWLLGDVDDPVVRGGGLEDTIDLDLEASEPGSSRDVGRNDAPARANGRVEAPRSSVPEGVGSDRPAGQGDGVATIGVPTTGMASSSVGVGLAGLLHLTGVPVRCPEAPRVELAVDGQGHLHAIALDELSAEGPGAGRVGVTALLAADAWVQANFGLISRAMGFVKDGAVGLHLVTRVPAASRELLGTRVRVHLLARASAPGDVCVPLN